MRCVNLLVLLSFGPAAATGKQQKQGSCSSRRNKWCGASLLQTPKQGPVWPHHEHADQDHIRGELSETLDQLKFHELELEQLMGVEHQDPSVPASEPKPGAARAGAASWKKRPPVGLLTSGEHEHVPGSALTTWTCGKIKLFPNACGFFGGYVGFPFFAAVGILAVAIVAEMVLAWIEEPEMPPKSKGAARDARKKARSDRLASAHQGGNLSFAWKVRSCILFIVVVPVEILIFWQTGLLQDTWNAAAPYLVLVIVLGTCFFPACVSLCTCAKDVFEAIHERLDELFEGLDEVFHGAERAWEDFEEEIGIGHTDQAEGDTSKGAASEPAAAVASTAKKKKKSCC